MAILAFDGGQRPECGAFFGFRACNQAQQMLSFTVLPQSCGRGQAQLQQQSAEIVRYGAMAEPIQPMVGR